MKNNPFTPKVPLQNKRSNLKSGDTTKTVEFKKKSFEFKASTLEECKGVFNHEVSFSNPNKSEMFLFIEKIFWHPSKTLVDGIIKIVAAYPGGQTEKIYNSKITLQSSGAKRNINLTYTIKEGAEIKVNFECLHIDGENQKYSLLYKWLDPSLAKK